MAAWIIPGLIRLIMDRMTRMGIPTMKESAASTMENNHVCATARPAPKTVSRLAVTRETQLKYSPPAAQPVRVSRKTHPRKPASEPTSTTDCAPSGLATGNLAVIRLETPTGNVRRIPSRLNLGNHSVIISRMDVIFSGGSPLPAFKASICSNKSEKILFTLRRGPSQSRASSASGGSNTERCAEITSMPALMALITPGGGGMGGRVWGVSITS